MKRVNLRDISDMDKLSPLSLDDVQELVEDVDHAMALHHEMIEEAFKTAKYLLRTMYEAFHDEDWNRALVCSCWLSAITNVKEEIGLSQNLAVYAHAQEDYEMPEEPPFEIAAEVRDAMIEAGIIPCVPKGTF